VPLEFVQLARGGQATAGTRSGSRGLGYTLPGCASLQSMTLTLHAPPSSIGPLMFHASASALSLAAVKPGTQDSV
jgi:hypothetical protein